MTQLVSERRPDRTGIVVGAAWGTLARTEVSVGRSSFRGEPTSLVVGEAQAPGSDLFAQDAVLFQEIVDDVALLLVEPASERDQDELQWMRQRRHGSQPIRG